MGPGYIKTWQWGKKGSKKYQKMFYVIYEGSLRKKIKLNFHFLQAALNNLSKLETNNGVLEFQLLYVKCTNLTPCQNFT